MKGGYVLILKKEKGVVDEEPSNWAIEKTVYILLGGSGRVFGEFPPKKDVLPKFFQKKKWTEKWFCSGK